MQKARAKSTTQISHWRKAILGYFLSSDDRSDSVPAKLSANSASASQAAVA
jgi:hypothetical protein